MKSAVTDTDIAPGSPINWLSRTAAGQTPNPKAKGSLLASNPDDDKSFKKKRDTTFSLRASAMAAPSITPSTSDVQTDELDIQAGTAMLRQSALPADSASAKQIITMENADVDAMITALAVVIHAYTKEAATQRKHVGPGGGCFDEQDHPLDNSSSWKQVPAASRIKTFLRNVVVALELDESSLVIGLILIERGMSANDNPLVISARTWRPTLLMGIVVASKIIYDEKVFLADYRDQLPLLKVTNAPEQERTFLAQIGYNTTVRRGQYAKYYYALEDVARCDWAEDDVA